MVKLLHVDTTTYKIDELQQKYRLGTVSNRLLVGLKRVLPDPTPRLLLLQWFQTFGSQNGFLNVMRQTACLVVNPIKVNSFADLFNCTTVGRTSD